MFDSLRNLCAAPMAGYYVSELTNFLRELKQQPGIEAGQRDGRAMLWDRQLDADLYRRFRESRLPQPGYVYQSATRRDEA